VGETWANKRNEKKSPEERFGLLGTNFLSFFSIKSLTYAINYMRSVKQELGFDINI